VNKFDWAAIVIALTGALAACALSLNTNARVERLEVPATVLVGFGCESPSSIAVATEEDLLPRCAEIERHEVARR
jgi:uncharacterized membrane protein